MSLKKSLSLVLLCNILLLYPILLSGYNGDDILNSQVPGLILTEFRSVYDLTQHYFWIWVNGQGRFFPFAWYVYAVFYNLDTLIAYKLSILFFVLLSVWSFGFLVYKITKSEPMAFLVMLLIPLFFQFRHGHDPIISYCWLMQLVFLYTIFSLICLLNFLENSKKRWFILSILFYIFSLLTYEISYLFFIFHWILILFFHFRHKKSLLLLIPSFLCTVTIIAFSLYLRSKATGIDTAYQISFDFKAYIATLIKQSSAAFPLSYYFANFSNILTMKEVLRATHFYEYMIALIVAIAANRFSKEIKLTKDSALLLFLLGGALLILPAAIISLSPRHHSWVALGVGYIPVFLQYFGALLMLASLFYSFEGKNSRIIPIIIIVAIFNMQTNKVVIQKINQESYYPSKLFELYIKSDEFNSIVKDNNIIVFDEYNHWRRPEFFYKHIEKIIQVDFKNEFIEKHKKGEPIPTKAFLLQYTHDKRAGGTVLLSEITSVDAQNSQLVLQNSKKQQIDFKKSLAWWERLP